MEQHLIVKSRSNAIWPFFFLSVAMLILVVIAVFYYPATVKVDPNSDVQLVLGDKNLGEGKVDIIRDETYLSYQVIKQYLDNDIFLEEETGKVIVTTKDKVIRMAAEELSARINSNAVSLHAPMLENNGVTWVPIEFLAPLYQIEVDYFTETNRVVITQVSNKRSFAVVSKQTLLRTAPGWRNSYRAKLQPGDKVELFGAENGYTRVRVVDGGLTGYVSSNVLKAKRVVLPEKEETVQSDKVWQPAEGEKINLTWEFVTRQNPDTDNIPDLPGVNVVSPTWFYLSDDGGNVDNRASSAYVNWAHKQGYQVWALFSNDFNPQRTHAVLSSATKREQVIDQLLVYARLYGFDGINIDFENVFLNDKELLVQFVRELTPLAHQQGLVVSIDVTIRGGSPNYSLFYDRQALGKVVDYVMLMTYDEYWASSPRAGSVASLPWVERGVLGLLEQVPKEKLLLGVPFYTRLWIETEHEDGSVTIKSKALSMEGAEDLIERHAAKVTFDQAAGQHYAQWRQGTTYYEIWLENEYSMRQRAALVNKYDLAGIASWRRGFEEQGIWRVIEEEIK